MRRFTILLVALSLAASACGDDQVDPVFLGPIEAGPAQDAAVDAKQPVPSQLPRSACAESTPLVGPDIANTLLGIATRESSVLIAQPGSVRAVTLESEHGCPSVPIASFGTNGILSVDASAAAPVGIALNLAATPSGILILDSTGTEVGRCQTAAADGEGGEDIVARSLQLGADGTVVASFTKAPVWRLTIEKSPLGCVAEPFTLSAPLAFAQVGAGRDGGFVTVEQTTATSALVVVRYDAQGTAVASSKPLAAAGPAALCSATGLVDTPKGIFVTDSTCRRVVLFEPYDLPNPEAGSPSEGLRVTGELSFDLTPRGAALTPDETQVLVGLVEAIEGGAIAGFEQVGLP